jgi:hypothetical protein
MMKVVECMEDDSMHKKARTSLVTQLTTKVSIKSATQIASGPKRSQKRKWDKNPPKDKRIMVKRSCEMLLKSNVSIATSWGTWPRTMKRSHTFVCKPMCSSMIQMGSHKDGQTHQGPHSTRNHDTDMQGGVGGHFGMWQGEVYK